MASASSSSPLPHIHLLCYHEPDQNIFQAALAKASLPSRLSIEFHTGSLRVLDSDISFDLVVSPANSYGRMDGGFDDALSRAFSPRGDYLALTHVVQEELYKEWRGFAPPGTCTLVPFDFSQRQGAEEGWEDLGGVSGVETVGRSGPKWGCKIVAVCPTMRQPEPIPWEREVVYECMWSLLCKIDRWNEVCAEGARIGSLLMTPLATGTGGVSAEKWATQVLLAIKHFMEAKVDRKKWSRLDVWQIQDLCNEVATTHRM